MRTMTRSPWMVALCATLALAACKGDDRGTATADRSTAGGDVAAGVRVADVTVGRGLDADRKVRDETDDFRARDTVYAAVHTTGSASSATLRARWTFQDGQVVDETTRSISPTGDAVTEFHISKPDGLPAGKYRVEIYLDDKQVGNEEFEVKT